MVKQQAIDLLDHARNVSLQAEGMDGQEARSDALPRGAGILDLESLSEVGGLRYREIGALSGAPEGTIASRKNRAIRLVRERWAARWKEETR